METIYYAKRINKSGGEIILRSMGVCNLTEVVVRPWDTDVTLAHKVKLATILGTFQSSLTNFKYIRKQWKQNAEEERLLGVSLTGIMDHPQLQQTNDTTKQLLIQLRQIAEDVNNEWATKLNIQKSSAITTVKPSGTVSQLVDSASGIHPRHNHYYIRTVRADSKDPLALFLKNQGVPCEEDQFNKSNLVFSFPIASPGSVTRNDVGAIQQLEHYLMFQQYWCHHNPSITVYVKPHEWLEVGAWVYKNLDFLGGVSFLPSNDHIYPQAPYQDCSLEHYEKAKAAFPVIEWEEFDKFEVDDATINMHELACVNGSCELP